MTDETIRALAEEWATKSLTRKFDPLRVADVFFDFAQVVLARQGEELARCLADEEMTNRRAERAEQERDEARAALAKEKEK